MTLPPKDPRRSRAWRILSARVRQEEPICWLQLAGCTGVSETADHVIPVIVAPELALVRTNLRGACIPCNSKRQDLPVDQLDHLRGDPAGDALAWFD